MRGHQAITEIEYLQNELKTLRQKYADLSLRLESEKMQLSGEDSINDLNSLLEEKSLLEQHISRVEKEIKVKKKGNLAGLRRKRGDRVQVGSKVLISSRTHSLKFRLVDQCTLVDKDAVSAKSPVGKGVLGKRVGECFKILSPKGIIPYQIAAIYE